MKVYIVDYIYYEDSNTYGVYSSKERADQRVEELRKADPSFPYYYCSEYTLDEDCTSE